MSEHHVGLREAIAMTVLLLSAKIFLPLPRHLAELAGTAGWMIMVIGALISGLTVVSMLAILRRYPGKSLMVATEAILGPLFGTIANLLYFLGFFANTFLVLRQFSENFSFTVLLRTPLAVVIIILLFSLTFVAYQGVETIGRLSWLLVPPVLGGLFLLLLGGLMTHTEPNALAPYLGKGIGTILAGGVSKTAMYGEILILGVIAPAFRKPDEVKRASWLSLLFSMVILTGSVIAYFFVFPYPGSTRVGFPLLSVSRIISIGRWLSRLEGIFLINWILSAVLMLALSLFGATAVLSQTLRLRNYRFLFFPLAILTYAFSLLPANLVQATNWSTEYLRTYGGIISVGVPLLTAGVAWLSKKGGAQRATS